MKYVFSSIGLIVVSISPLTAQMSRNWPIGVEREVDEGTYMKVLAVQNGWRIWRIETKNRVDCRAIKSARGRVNPVPVGVGAAFYDGTPNLMIYQGDGLTLSWSAKHYGKVHVKTRAIGAKFWDDMETYTKDLKNLDGRVLDVNITSWEYPEIYVGYSDETAVIDLTGMKSAIDAINTCNEQGKIEKR